MPIRRNGVIIQVKTYIAPAYKLTLMYGPNQLGTAQ